MCATYMVIKTLSEVLMIPTAIDASQFKETSTSIQSLFNFFLKRNTYENDDSNHDGHLNSFDDLIAFGSQNMKNYENPHGYSHKNPLFKASYK